MSIDKIADSQKKLELATNIVIAYINSSKPSDKSSAKSSEKSTESSASLTEGQILDFLEKAFNKMHELVPHQERKVGLGR